MSILGALEGSEPASVNSGPWGDWSRRGRSYRTLGQLLHGVAAVRSDHFGLILELGCDCPQGAHLASGDLAGAGDAARRELARPGAKAALRAEWVRLFGERQFSALTDAISPCEVVYVAETADEHQRCIVASYESIGFDYRSHLTSHCDCPGHVAVEFAFAAFALDRACHGDTIAAVTSADFVRQHILRWVPLFAVALQHKACHPVMQFAALATERFMCCEARRAGVVRMR